jgi:hypothetical protein
MPKDEDILQLVSSAPEASEAAYSPSLWFPSSHWFLQEAEKETQPGIAQLGL